MQQKIRHRLTASTIWMTVYQLEAAPCDLCPDQNNRITTRTAIYGTHISKTKLGQDVAYHICYKCMGKLHLRRELEQPQAERALYTGRRRRT